MPDELRFRTIGIRIRKDGPATFDREKRSVEVVLSSEQPVVVWGEKEILLSAGARIPKDKKIVMLDTPNRFTVDGVLGSIRNLHKSDGKIVGTAFFSERQKAEDALTLVEEGHLTDFSVGYKVNKVERIGENETRKIKGRDYEGPVVVVTSWIPREGSIAPIGSDSKAKVRANESKEKGGQEMPEKIVTKETEVTAAVQSERARIGEITAMCDRLGCSHLRQKMVDEGVTLDDARQRVIDWQMAQNEPTVPAHGRHSARIEAGETAEEKRRDAAIGGILLRVGGFAENDLPPGSREYAARSLIDLARESCRAAGTRVKNLSPTKIYERAMTTGDFPAILGTSQEKILQVGYEEAGTTWETWAKPRPVENFKTQKRPKLSEFDNLDEIPEHGEYQYGDPTEFEEEYVVVTYGKLLALTRQTIVNDDLAAFARISRGHGAAAARRVNAVVYSILTANAAMSDGDALFHANHGNLGTAGAPSWPEVATAAVQISAGEIGFYGRGLSPRPRGCG